MSERERLDGLVSDLESRISDLENNFNLLGKSLEKIEILLKIDAPKDAGYRNFMKTFKELKEKRNKDVCEKTNKRCSRSFQNNDKICEACIKFEEVKRKE